MARLRSVPTSLCWEPLQGEAQSLAQGVLGNVAKRLHWPIDPHCPQALESRLRLEEMGPQLLGLAAGQ